MRCEGTSFQTVWLQQNATQALWLYLGRDGTRLQPNQNQFTLAAAILDQLSAEEQKPTHLYHVGHFRRQPGRKAEAERVRDAKVWPDPRFHTMHMSERMGIDGRHDTLVDIHVDRPP